MREFIKEFKKNTSRSFYIFNGILLLIIMWGFYNWGLALIEGPGITGSNDFVPWGLFLVGFVFFVGASAGATLIGLMIHAFSREDYKVLGIRAILIGLLSLLAAVLNLMMDVGQPIRAVLIPWVLHNMTSMLIYTSSTYFIFGGLFLAELFYALKIARGTATQTDEKIAKWLAIIAVPFALGILHAPHGALFAVVKARDYWHTPLLPPHFAVSALVTGTSFMILMAIVTSKIEKKELVSRGALEHMGGLLAFFITLNLFFDFYDIFVLKYSEEPEGIEILNLLTGRFVPFFILNFGGLFLALMVLLNKRGRSIRALTFVSCLSILAILAYRWDLVIGGQILPLLPGFPEIHYYPTIPEIAMEAGIIALFLFLYTLLTKILPMEEGSPKPIEAEIGIIKKWR
ncbi:MAG: NrfD/PsrC family molybdoenzyme membrane anchor subunit [Thermodesulfovibrionia bacterium]|nr:NrfD/PsrC family molybdoenzyme membrane anchor subunit [Thermodesulfovibrionia bacterium]